MATALAAGVALAVAVVALVVGGHDTSRVGGPHHVVSVARAQVLFPALESRPAAYAAGESVYVVVYTASGETWIVPKPSPPGHVAVQAPIAIGPDNVAGDVDDMLVAHGRLWVTATRGQTTELFWTDAHFRSWSVSSIRLAGPTAPRRAIGRLGAGHSVGSMAVAGGWLWVAVHDGLDRVSLATGRVTAKISRAGTRMAGGISIAAAPAGTVLVVSQAGYIQRLDPHTGEVIATAGPFGHGAIVPQIGGIIDGGAWITGPTGNRSYIERLDVNTLEPTAIPTNRAHVNSQIQARVIDGILWVTEAGGTDRLNYCADPITGRPRAPLPIPPRARFLTAGPKDIYYSRSIHLPGEPKAGFDLLQAPIDPRCG